MDDNHEGSNEDWQSRFREQQERGLGFISTSVVRDF